MKKSLALLAACALCNMGNTCATMPPDSVLHAELTPEEAMAIPPMYATVAVRRALADGDPVTRPTVDLARVARGRRGVRGSS